MSFRTEARVGVQADSHVIWDIVADLSSWSRWNPVWKDAEGTIAFGGVMRWTETIDGLPERRAEVGVADWVPGSRLKWGERRGWLFNSTGFIDIEELEPGSCIVTVGEIYSGWRGEGYLEKHRSQLKAAARAVAEALRTQAESLGR